MHAINATALHNPEIERGLLGAILRNPTVVLEIESLLTAEDFFRDAHQVLYRLSRERVLDGLPIDPASLGDALLAIGQLDAIGGHAALIDLLVSATIPVNARYYARVIHQKAIIRRLLELSGRLQGDCLSMQFTAGQIISRLQADLLDLQDTGSTQRLLPATELLPPTMERIMRRSLDGEVTGIGSGLKDLDDILGGFQPEQLVILAARPSMGKSALALNLCDHASVDLGLCVLFLTLEMGSEQMVERMIVARARISGQRARMGHLDAPDLSRARAASEVLARTSSFFDDTPAQTVLQVLSSAHSLALRQRVDLIILDYLQLMEPDEGTDRASRQEQVSRISRRLKGLARDLKIPILALSQLNRQLETREDRRPRMSDLRESGSIEQDADVVLLLHRPDYYDPSDQPGVAELIVAKNRNGATGTVKLAFHKESMRFDLLDERIY
jgi:replicative DNA helicase